MSNSKSAFILLIATSLLLASCSDIYYVPSAQNVPLHREKDELKLTGGKSISNETEGWNLRSSYSFTDHFAGIVSYSSVADNNDSTSRGAGSTWRAGLGYYTPLNNSKWVFETYAGAGGGNGNLNRSPSEFMSYHATELFMQQAIGYSGDYTFIALSAKTSRLAYSNIFRSNHPGQYPLDEKNTHLFFEPALTLRLGYQYGFFELQVVQSYNLTDQSFPMDPMTVNFGINLNLKPVIHHLKSSRDSRANH